MSVEIRKTYKCNQCERIFKTSVKSYNPMDDKKYEHFCDVICKAKHIIAHAEYLKTVYGDKLKEEPSEVKK